MINSEICLNRHFVFVTVVFELFFSEGLMPFGVLVVRINDGRRAPSGKG